MADLNEIINEYSRKYVAAVEKEQAIRDSAFISNIDVIGNTTVHALTPKLFTTLTLMKSPLVMGGEINSESILVFLWTVKVKIPEDDRQKFFEETILNQDFEQIVTDIGTYFEDAFQDIPPAKSEGSNVPYYSSLAVIVDYFASEYGWTEDSIINMPYKRLFQYMKLIGKKNDPSKAMFNKSDNIKSQMIQAISTPR